MTNKQAAITKELTKEELFKLINDDPLDRNKEIITFINMLNDCEKPISIALDGDWGSGKTVFVRHLEMILEALNDQLNGDNLIEEFVRDNDAFSDLQDTNILPLYFNAWENDWYNEPLSSLISEITKQTEKKFKEKLHVDFFQIAIDVFNMALKFNGVPLAIPDIKKCAKRNEYLKDFHTVDEFRLKVVEYLKKMQAHKNSTILLIIDELDRCKPDYALKLIEQLKALFLDGNIIILYSVNENELANIIERCYGFKNNGKRYLQRVYDFSLSLPSIDYNKLAEYQHGNRDSDLVLRKVEYDICSNSKMTIRDYQHFNSYIEKLKNIKQNSFGYESAFVALSHIICPLLISLKLFRNNLYDNLVTNLDGELLLTELKKFPETYRNFKVALGYEVSMRFTSPSYNESAILKFIIIMLSFPINNFRNYASDFDSEYKPSSENDATAFICNAMHESVDRSSLALLRKIFL